MSCSEGCVHLLCIGEQIKHGRQNYRAAEFINDVMICSNMSILPKIYKKIMKHANSTYDKRIDARRQVASAGRVALKAASNVMAS